MTDPTSRMYACIVTYGAPQLAQSVRASLASEFHTVVVSTSAQASHVADLRLPNVGYGSAANAAFGQLGSRQVDWWVVANDDLTLSNHAAVEMRTRLTELPDHVVMWSFTGASTAISPRRKDVPSETASPHGALVAVRGDVYRALGGFDPRFFLYGEEVDLWLRLPSGLNSGFEDAPFVSHQGAASTRSRLSASFELGRSTAVIARLHGRVMRTVGRVVTRTVWVIFWRGRPRAAAGFAAGFTLASVAPNVECVAKRALSAASRHERSELGRVSGPVEPAARG